MRMLLQSLCGQDIRILKQGVFDKVAGFRIARHAEIEINGRLKIGDVIYSQSINKYYASKMHLDVRLNRCVLHIATRDTLTNLRIRKHNGQAIPTIINTEA